MNTRPMVMAMPALLLLAGCAPATSNTAAKTSVVNAGSVQAPPPVAQAEPASMPLPGVPAAKPAGASIGGAIREGNRPPPALRVCATPVRGGTPTCIETTAGAREYRIDVAPGRYYLLGWVRSGELTLIAHASQIRCIRAPCPPDSLIGVRVAAGQHLQGVDLNGSYVNLPDGWPTRPR